MMNVVILTQDDPFYLGKQLDYLFANFPDGVNVTGCVVFDVSPFGKKESIVDKAIKTWKIFGSMFFLRYVVKYLRAKLVPYYKVDKVLQRHGISRIHAEGSINSVESLDAIRARKPDLLISVAGNQIFKRPLIDLAPQGCLNLHTALLPKYRGLMPSFWVLKNGEKETGVSVFFVDEGIDSGPILVQKRVTIDGRSLEELIQYTKRLGMDAIIEAVTKIREGAYETMPNPEENSSYYSFPNAQDVAAFRQAGKRFY